jgi:hypothetical protein
VSYRGHECFDLRPVTVSKANCSLLFQRILASGIVALMVSPVERTLQQPVSAPSRPQAERKRWSLFLSIFGARAVSLLLWTGIFLFVDFVGQLADGLF